MKTVVNWLVDESFLPPSARLKYPLRKAEGSDTYCYAREEFRAIINHCRAVPKLEWLGNVVVALGHLGVRIGELIELRWKDVDPRTNIVRIVDERASKRKTKAGTARKTKGRRSRCIPIHPGLRKLLLKLEHKQDGRVFHAALGGVLRENNALKIFKEQVIGPLSSKFPTLDGDIGFADGTFHSFRHFFCSQCFLGGASEGEIREWMGHRDSKIVELYRHLRNEDAQRKMEQIDFLGSDEEDKPQTDVA